MVRKPDWFSDNQIGVTATRKPDWTDLMPELVNVIASQLIANDVSDFIRFRAVCRSWLSSTGEMISRANRLYHPRNWIMLSNPKLTPTEPVQFYNTFTHASFWFDPTDYLDQYSLFRTFACPIILQNKNTQEFAVLNSMRSVTELPSNIVSDCPNAPTRLDDIIQETYSVNSRLSDVYITSSSTIVLKFSALDYLVWTKPGDESWVYAEFKVICFTNAVFHDDRILVVDPVCGVVQISFANAMSSQPHVVVVFTNHVGSFDGARHLVVCDDAIFMVTHPFYDGAYSFKMYDLDLKNMTCIPSTNLGDYSLFLGLRTFSVSSKSRHISKNCIYFCNQHFHENTMYDLSTNQLKFSTREPFMKSDPLVRKLIQFSLRSHPILLRQENGSIIFHYED